MGGSAQPSPIEHSARLVKAGQSGCSHFGPQLAIDFFQRTAGPVPAKDAVSCIGQSPVLTYHYQTEGSPVIRGPIMYTPRLEALLLTAAEVAAAKEDIKKLAFCKWKDAGSPENSERDFWMEAQLEWIEYRYVPHRFDPVEEMYGTS